MRIGILATVATAIAIGVVVAQGGGSVQSCPLPAYPDETCTGVPAGTSLTAYSGPTTITANDTVIDSKTVTSCLRIEASNVTIRNSTVDCTPGAPPAIHVVENGVASLLFEDSELHCGAAENSHGLGELNITVRRSEITGCENGLTVQEDVTVEESYIHALSDFGADPHSDGMQFDEGADNVDIIHNTIFGMMGTGDSDFGTSSLIADLANHSNWLIEHNLFGGGAYSVYCAVDPATNWVIRNNAFTTRFHVNVGFFGHGHPSCLDDTQSGNFILETDEPIFLGDNSGQPY